MARMIELHRDDKEHTPVVVNADWIMWFEQRKNYTIVALGFGSLSGNSSNFSTHSQYISVDESYEELKDLLNI